MRWCVWRGPRDRAPADGSKGDDRTAGYTRRDLEEVVAQAGRAERRGIDPRRVLAALGVDLRILDGPDRLSDKPRRVGAEHPEKAPGQRAAAEDAPLLEPRLDGAAPTQSG